MNDIQRHTTAIIERLRDIGDATVANYFFDLIADLISRHGIAPDDPRLSLNTRNESSRRRFSVSINGRLVAGLRTTPDGNVLLFALYEEDFERLRAVIPGLAQDGDKYRDEEPQALTARASTHVLMDSDTAPLLSAWHRHTEAYLPRQVASQYRKHHMPLLYGMATDKKTRSEVFDDAGLEINATNFEDMEYFDLKGLKAYQPFANKTYSSDTNAAEWYKDTHEKFDHLIALLAKRLNAPLVVNYRQRPGANARHVPYVLRGFSRPGLFENGEVFIKLQFGHLQTDAPNFAIEIDSNFKREGNPFSSRSEELKESSWDVPVDENFPTDWNSLLDLIEPEVRSKLQELDALTVVSVPTISGQNGSQQIHHLNTILYGPPGTGKTFSSIAHALAIIEGKPLKEINSEKREEVKARFDELLIRDWDNPKGQIGFITFHQSLSYEDFVEGIKPIPPAVEGEAMTYDVVPGILKRMAQVSSVRAGNFEEVVDKLKADTFEGSGVPVTVKAPSTTFDLKYRGGTVFYVHPHNSTKPDAWYPVNIYHIERFFEDGHIEGTYNPTYVREISGYMQRERGLRKSHSADTEHKPYILIIDEINRGNVSQIFGELITLIEDGKRTGQPEALSVTLPYSRENFSVPPNLYLIGTMNTADRSVEALDTALRRRFSFVEMPPEEAHPLIPTAVNIGERAFNFQTILATINRRLEKLAGRDHKIGHSYFILKEGTPPWQHFLHAFTDKIIPLLQEYFYADWGRMCLVLGQGFVTLEPGKTDGLFAALPTGERATTDALPDLREREVWRLADFKNTANAEARFADALDTLMGKTLPAQAADDAAHESDGDE